MNKPKNSPARKMVAENRKARYNFEISDTLEAGLVLTGTEVKSLRANQANIAESYASFENGEFWLINSYIPEYTQGNRFNHEPRRLRKLLISRREMARIFNSVSREGMTVVPLKLYFNDRGRAKLEIGVARGKKNHDKRETEKQRDWNREVAPAARSRLRLTYCYNKKSAEGALFIVYASWFMKFEIMKLHEPDDCPYQ